MSWKLFWQIVLLIVIAAVIFSTVKCGLLGSKCGSGGKYFKSRSGTMQKGMMHKDMMHKGMKK